MWKLLKAALCALALTGCAATYKGQPVVGSALDPKLNQKAPIVTADHGLIALSIATDRIDARFLFATYKADPEYKITLQVRNNETGQRYQFERIASFLFGQNDFELGSVHAHALPAGEYAITDFRIFHVIGMEYGTIESVWVSPTEFSIPFSVAPKSTQYLGEWRCLPKYHDGFFGKEANGCRFAVSDQFGRDAPLLRAKYPETDWTKLTNATLKSGQVPPSVVEFR